MNKTTLILEKAKRRLEKAEKEIQDEKQREDVINMIAERMDENDVFMFIDPSLEGVIIYCNKTSNIIH